MASDHADQLAHELLTGAALGLECAGIEPPDRRFVSHGRPPWDCELLAVHLDRPSFSVETQAPPNTCSVRPRFDLVITLLRCYPIAQDAGPPSVAELNAGAAALNADFWALMRWLGEEGTTGALFDGLACKAVRLGTPGSVLVPQGGLAGWEFPLTVAPDDTDPRCEGS